MYLLPSPGVPIYLCFLSTFQPGKTGLKSSKLFTEFSSLAIFLQALLRRYKVRYPKMVQVTAILLLPALPLGTPKSEIL
jgi:hypothetical protein